MLLEKKKKRKKFLDTTTTIDFKTEDDRPGRFCGQGLNSASGCRDRRRSIIAPVAGKSKK